MPRKKGYIVPRPLDGREIDDCPAQRHRHSDRLGWYVDGCRCPSTVAAHEKRLEQKVLQRARSAAEAERRRQERAAEARRIAALPERERYREVDECPASKHHFPGSGGGRWRAHSLGCICPSTIKSWTRRREILNESARRQRDELRRRLATSKAYAKFHLGWANQRDAEAIAMGYRTGPVDKNTRALAVQMMLDKNPKMTDRQIGWRLEAAGQKGTDVRSINRIVATLNFKRKKRGLPPYDRSTTAGDSFAVSPLHRRNA